MKTNHAVLSLLFLLLFGLRAEATVYTVKAAGGGNFTTISACSGTAVAGDTCDIFTGSYSGWTQSNNGTAANPITFTEHAGNTVTVTSNVSIASRSYITISFLTFNGAGVTGNGTTNHNVIDHNTFINYTMVFRINDGLGSNGSDNVFSNNTVNINSISSRDPAIYLYGDRNRIENNEIFGGGGDCMGIGGNNVVVRGNYCHDLNGATSGEHIDFVQVIGGGTSPTLSFSLIENNVERNCLNDAGNCHFLILRTCSGAGGCSLVGDSVIARFNYAQNLDGTGFSMGGVGDNAPNAHLYNNTIATEVPGGENGGCGSFQNAPAGVAVNNICYNTQTGPWAPFVWASASSGDRGAGNITYTTGYAGTWNSPYSGESTYSALRNKDPKFANYPAAPTLQAGSPAINGGVAHTTVGSGDSGSGTSLVVTDARFFQPGWAGVQGDWIRVGASATAQIASINYSTNTLTLTSAITRSAGAAVSLYKNSAGTVVLSGSLPHVGAFQAAGSGGAPSAPTGFSVGP